MLMNLGSPDSTSVPDVRKYLKEFLMDGRVIDQPWLLRTLLVKGIIVPFRAPKSAEAYETIWTDEGSPLVVLTKQLKSEVDKHVSVPVSIGMRYGNPSPLDAYEEMLKQSPDLEEVLLVPLYPHYAMSSYETAVEYAKDIHKEKGYKFTLQVIPPYYDNDQYIAALADRIAPYLKEDYDQLLFSYHGIPGRHIRKSDVTGCHCLVNQNCCETPSTAHAHCYRHQVRKTTQRVVELLKIPDGKWSLSFQSRLGKGWLEPFTDIRLGEMPKEGIKNIKVVCPAFVSDCLETLEEIAIRGKESFMEAGGEKYEMIPCLNTSPLWVDTIVGWINDFTNT